MNIGKTGNIHYVKQEAQFYQMLATLMRPRGFFQLISGQQISIYYLKIIRHIQIIFDDIAACFLRVRIKGFQFFDKRMEIFVATGWINCLYASMDSLIFSISYYKPSGGIRLGKPELICNFKNLIDQVIE